MSVQGPFYRTKCEVCEDVWEHGAYGTGFGVHELLPGSPQEVNVAGCIRYPVCPECERRIRSAADDAYKRIRASRGLK